MTLSWRYSCDGDGCKAVEVVECFSAFPVGWLRRVITDCVESLEPSSTGTGFGGGRSELQAQRHYCSTCRRKVVKLLDAWDEAGWSDERADGAARALGVKLSDLKEQLSLRGLHVVSDAQMRVLEAMGETDCVESLEPSSTGTGFGGGRSELQAQRHYCSTCRRKVVKL